MSRCRKDPLRPLTDEERSVLTQVARAQSEPASQVARAKLLLAVADGKTYQAAAETAGRQSNDTVAHLVSRFNREGLAALVPRHGGGPAVAYGATERERIVAEARRQPDRARDGTATWTLSTLQRALRQAPDGLPGVSIYTIWCVLRKAGLSWQKSRTWCETGKVKRKRKAGVVEVIDPDTEAKKNQSKRHIQWVKQRGCLSGPMTKLAHTRRNRKLAQVGNQKVIRCGNRLSISAMKQPKRSPCFILQPAAYA